MYIYIRRSVHITCRFLIYRWGPALPPPCHRHKCPPMGGATVPALYQGVLGRGLLCLEVSKASFLDLSGHAEASLAPAESLAQPRGTGNCCAKASTVASWQQSVTASSRFPVCRSLLPPASSCTRCQLQGADPGPLSRPPAGCLWHSGTQRLPLRRYLLQVRRVGLIPSMVQDGPSVVPPALDQPSLCAGGATVPRPSSVSEEQTRKGPCCQGVKLW